MLIVCVIIQLLIMLSLRRYLFFGFQWIHRMCRGYFSTQKVSVVAACCQILCTGALHCNRQKDIKKTGLDICEDSNISYSTPFNNLLYCNLHGRYSLMARRKPPSYNLIILVWCMRL